MQHTVSISDAKVSNVSSDTLVTYSLGSCIGVAVWDPHVPCAGLLHFQLPSGAVDPERARSKPLMFGDTGLAWLIAEMEKKGALRKRMKVKLAGGARMFQDKSSTFDIGKRNHTAIRKALWQSGLFVTSEEVGGSVPRTVYQNVGDGKTLVKRGGETVEL